MEEIKEILADEAKLNLVTKAVFDQVDADGSGQIDKHEFKQALHLVAGEAGLPVPTEEQVAAALNGLDADHSGTLSVDEFKNLVRALLEALISE